jgi:hypothetical protein
MRNGMVRLSLPSKGQLGDSTLMFFQSCGLRVNTILLVGHWPTARPASRLHSMRRK